MQLQTKVDISEYPFRLKYAHRLLSVGSCFSVHTASRLKRLKYRVWSNPFGITFNPASIALCIKRCIAANSLLDHEIIYQQGLYAHHDFHGSFNDINLQAFAKNANRSIEETHGYLSAVEGMIITLGTAYVFRKRSDKQIVNNCHKVPSSEFDRELLSVDQIVDYLSEVIDSVIAFSDHTPRFIFTVSPVRHIRDGLHENQISKSSLLLAVHRICSEHPSAFYFPSYEIVMDELRDYRFYDRDMIHPSPIATDNIFERFSQSLLDPDELPLRQTIDKVQTSLAHRPLHQQSPDYLQFLRKLKEKTDNLEKQYPHVSFREEWNKLSLQNPDSLGL